MSIKKILVPIDFLDSSIGALKYAIRLAETLHAKITIVHSVARFDAFTDIDMPQLYAEAKEQVNQQFESLKKDFSELDAVLDDFMVDPRLVEELVSKLVHEKKIDLIIMGTNGVSGVIEGLIGSNTFKVLEEIKCPLLVVPFEANLNLPKKLGLALDYRNIPNETVLKKLSQLAKYYTSEIHILNVSKTDRIGNYESSQARRLEQYFKNIPHQYHFEIDEDVEDGINNYLSENEIDLLTIVRHEHKLLDKIFKKNIAKKMVFHCNVPLLIMSENNKS